MKNLYTLLVLLLISSLGFGQTAGDLLITEFMADPLNVGDAQGEYFEIYNTTGSPIDINGWTIEDDGSDSHVIGSSVVVPANGFAILAIGANPAGDGSVTPDYVYSGFTLANGGDEIVLTRPGPATEIARVNYNDGDEFGDGIAIELEDISIPVNGAYTISGSGTNAVAATDNLGSGSDKGSPGSAGNTIGIPSGSSNDTDTEILAPTTQVSSSTIVAATTTTAMDAVPVFRFDIEDQGTADGLATNVTRMRFVPGPNNTADWTDHIQDIVMTNLTTATDLTPLATVTINDLEIIVDYGPAAVILDNSLNEFELEIYLNVDEILDGAVVQMQIPDVGSGFLADPSGSTFLEPQPGTITGPQMPIDVIGTELEFLPQPQSFYVVNTTMAPIAVQAQDINGNVDMDYVQDIDITSSGVLTGDPVTETAVNGVATFNTLTHTATGAGIDLTASDGSLPDVTSTPFTIAAFTPTCNSIFSDDFASSLFLWANTTNWIIDSEELRHNGSGESEDYIYADYGSQDLSSGEYEWSFCMRNGNWDPSTGNRFAFFLLSNETDLLSTPDGYAVGINQGGSSSDLIAFYSVTNGTFSEIITSVFNWDGNDDVCIRVTRSTSGEWELFYDANGGGELSAGTIVNTDHTSGNYLGPIFDFTSSRAGELWIDDVNVCKVDGSIRFTYDGSTWLPGNPEGVSNSVDNITINSGDIILTTSTTCNQFTVSAGAGLTINSGVTLTANTLDLDSTSDSYASLILDGTLAGGIVNNVTYRRHVNGAGSGVTGGNDLITSPLTGLFFVDIVQDPENEFNLFGNPDNGSTSILEYLFGPFDNDNGVFQNYFINDPLNGGGAVGDGDDAFESIEPARGYRAGTFGGITLAFRGGVNTATVFNDISIGSDIDFGPWNLAANPFPSYIDAELFLTHIVSTQTSGERNIDLLDGLSGIYGYDGDATNGWDVITLVNDNGRFIAPGQGFFVAADASQVAAHDLEFTPAMRTTSGGDDFILGRNSSPLTFLKLNAATADKNYNTDFYFDADASQGLDAGYDAKVWGGNAPDFALYSHLVQNNTGIPIALQALSATDFNDVVIPLGVNANAGEQLTFSITESTLPSDINVYLEDNVSNTFTLLNNGDYILTPLSSLNGTGRFYLRFSANVLSIDDSDLTELSIYNDGDRAIVIAGELLQPSTAKIFDLQGRLVMTKTLDITTREQRIETNQFSSGVYIIQINNEVQSISQKIIIR